MTDFSKILALAREEQRLQNAILRQRARATRMAAPTISDMPRSGSGTKQRLEEDVVIMATLQEECEIVRKELEEARVDLKRDIRRIKSATIRTMLRMRYLQNRRIADITADLNYSERHTQRMIRDGEIQIWQIQRSRKTCR